MDGSKWGDLYCSWLEMGQGGGLVVGWKRERGGGVFFELLCQRPNGYTSSA